MQSVELLSFCYLFQEETVTFSFKINGKDTLKIKQQYFYKKERVNSQQFCLFLYSNVIFGEIQNSNVIVKFVF